MGWYSRVVFPRLCDFLLDRPWMARLRRAQLAAAGGNILEIGAGTGLNLPHYPPDVRSLTTVEPSAAMNRLLERRAVRARVMLDRRIASAERMPFENEAFDTVVSTLTLCSIGDARRAVREIQRVLKPGGKFLFLEHGAAPEAGVRTWQRRLNPVQRIVGDGCRLDLDIAGLVRSVPFASLQIEQFYAHSLPRTHGAMYLGKAVR